MSLNTLRKLIALVAGAILVSTQCSAFSLLGPYEPWMTQALGYQSPGDIGGPMDLKAGYRWNVPSITYGFDQSFIDYFGTNGVAEVEKAIAILNALPPASSINFNDYPLLSKGLNFQAQSQGLIDLKSLTLSLLLEQMGLSCPYKGFALRSVDSNGTGAPVYTVLVRNYDPLTQYPTNGINGVRYNYHLIQGTSPASFALALDQVYLDGSGGSAVVGSSSVSGVDPGEFFTGLTRDDVGGLRYLLSANNLNVESLPPNVYPNGENQSFVNTAIRPGVEKLHFIPHTRSSIDGSFLTLINQFIDTYISGGVTNQQSLRRVIAQPDILFTMANIDSYERTGTSNWVNNAAQNGNSSGAGPGVIQPGIVIKFSRMGVNFQASTGFSNFENPHWASYDGTANPPVPYPVTNSVPGATEVKIQFDVNPASGTFTLGGTHWTLPAPPTPDFTLHTSTDLINWTVITNFPNNGFFHSCTYTPGRAEGFRVFRLVPAPPQ